MLRLNGLPCGSPPSSGVPGLRLGGGLRAHPPGGGPTAGPAQLQALGEPAAEERVLLRTGPPPLSISTE